MATLFAMPKLGLNMVEGIIIRWMVNEGDEVKTGQPILEIETDKAAQEVESPADGVLAKITRQEGETVPCNTVMAVILKKGEVLPAAIPNQIVEGVAPTSSLGGKTTEAGPASSQAEDHRARDASEGEGRIPISPAAKALAIELGVDLSKIKPRGSRIMREDVEAAYEAKKARPAGAPGFQKKEMSSIRRKISEHMSQSARSVARVGLELEADASRLMEWREAQKSGGKKYSYNVLLAKLVAIALKEFPYMNARIDGDSILEMEDINIGIATDSTRGLLVPVLKNVNDRDVLSLQKEFDDLTNRAIEGKSKPEDLQGGTFTITNLGGFEIESFLPIINVPECAILGIGAIVKKAVVVNDAIKIQPRISLTLAFDHRLVDGAPAGKFLQKIKHLVEESKFS